MAEHHTQGRQGQGARRRRNNRRPNRHRMPRPDDKKTTRPSLIQRILSFFGFGKKKKANAGESADQKNRKQPRQNVRIAKGRNREANNQGGNPASRGRRRATSVPPTRNARLYVGNLSYEASESELEDLFKGFGDVRSVEIIYNTRTYKSKGYAFVEMRKLEDAQRAAEILHGQPFMGRELMVSAASEKTPDASQEDSPAASDTSDSQG
ncbi:MAG: RNA-binding protein [Akkermansia sp.]|nr:RNA-binding protein [Akkermansia sp.]